MKILLVAIGVIVVLAVIAIIALGFVFCVAGEIAEEVRDDETYQQNEHLK